MQQSLFLLLLLVFSTNLFAQDSLKISLRQADSLLLINNLSLIYTLHPKGYGTTKSCTLKGTVQEGERDLKLFGINFCQKLANTKNSSRFGRAI